MTTLENLYYGNITPNDRSIKRGGRFDNLLKLSNRNEDELVSTLTDKQKETFEKFKGNLAELNGIDEATTFAIGFKPGVRLVAEAMIKGDPSTEPVNN